jgi:hypothetical protein
MNARYRKLREEVEEVFARSTRLEDSIETHASPSGKYTLETASYTTGKDTWNYARGRVTRNADGAQIADIRRNYGVFWHAWVAHPNGFEYLLSFAWTRVKTQRTFRPKPSMAWASAGRASTPRPTV